MALLNVDKLSVHFGDESAPFRAVDRISYSVKQGEVVGIVGESGSGKSVSSLAIMGLIDYPGRVMAEKLEFNGQDLQRISEKERRNLVGAEVAMIFQDPMTSLNPCYTVGFQIMEAIKVHQGGNKSTRRQRAIDLLNQVGIPDPASRLDVYPHQLSGGMSQRVMIAMAIACRPKLLIADEPTTALDVTIQARCRRPYDLACHCAGYYSAGGHCAYDTLLDAGSAGRGLHPHRARQRANPHAGDYRPCAA